MFRFFYVLFAVFIAIIFSPILETEELLAFFTNDT